jgi:hypothetical protein
MSNLQKQSSDGRNEWLARGAIGPCACSFANSYEALDFAWEIFGARHLSAQQHTAAGKLIIKLSIECFLKEYIK